MPHSIFIIDDSAEDRYLLKRYLKKSGLETTITEASNGEQALNMLLKGDELRTNHPEIQSPLVIFLDVNMPIMNGWEFLKEFREKRDQIFIKSTKIIMYSTSDDATDIARIKEFEFVMTYVVKGSYTPVQLKDTIAACVAE